MDRLSALITVLALSLSCEESKPEPAPSRVNGAKTTKGQGATVDAFCDVHSSADNAKPLAWPALTGAAPAPAATWRWINVWATWCKPCVDEIPRLAKWNTKLAAAGKKFDLAFVSVDESADDVGAFRKDHPEIASSLRLADSKAQDAWFAQLGLTGSPPIPIHVFVDPQQRVRCVRAGGVRDQDYGVVEKLLAE